MVRIDNEQILSPCHYVVTSMYVSEDCGLQEILRYLTEEFQ